MYNLTTDILWSIKSDLWIIEKEEKFCGFKGKTMIVGDLVAELENKKVVKLPKVDDEPIRKELERLLKRKIELETYIQYSLDNEGW